MQNVNQQLLNILLSSTYNEAQFPERLQILTAALQQMPAKRNRVDLAEQLKASALQSLTVASNVCKRNGGLPVEYVLQADTGLPGQYKLANQAGLPGQYNLVEQIGLPGQYKLAEQVGLPGQSRLADQIGLPGQNALPLQVASFLAKEILGGGPVDYVPTKTVTIRY